MVKKKRITSVPFESIVIDEEFNSRQEYTDIENLAKSIKEEGLLEPVGISVRDAGEGKKINFLVYGFRRYKAIQVIRAEFGEDAFADMDVVINEGNLEDLRIRNAKENLDRKNLSPPEIARLVKALVNSGLDQKEIGHRLGHPQSWVSFHYKVATKLTTKARKAFNNGEITFEQALNIADVPDDGQNEVVDKLLQAETRSEARQIVKNASKDATEKKKKYATKSRPTAKNMTQFVNDASFEATSQINSSLERSFYNGVAAGLRVALGDHEFEKLAAAEDYHDVNYAAKKDPPKKSKKKKDESEQTTVEVSAEDGDAPEVKSETAPPKRKRGRPRKKPESAAENTAI